MGLLPLIEDQMSVRPNALAITHGARALTYRELQQAAATTAQGLRQAGVQAGALVAVYLHRSPELLAALIAIWQVGAAYLPLDPQHPHERTRFMLQDSGATVVLSQTSLLGFVPEGYARVLNQQAFPRSPLLPRSPVMPAERLAYVIYTSGSTGKPKGAMISHGSLANTIRGLQRDLALQPSDVVLACNSFAFDVSAQEMYLPLMAGARIHLVERELAGDGPRLLQVLRDQGITVMMGLATTYRLMLDAGWQGDPNLQLTVGGEALSLELARLLAERSRALWNHYGPTETSICATSEKIDANVTRITLGKPLKNVRVYVLDEHLHPVPQGAIGEIYLGGAGVGLGYLNRPALTESCFLPDPFTERPGAIMYKTGDLGALLADNKLDFLGRADEQVKIRGFRIELQEIEAALEDCPGVQASIVRAIEFAPGDQRLIAFIAGRAEPGLEAGRLRILLRRRLPIYMVPSEFVVLPCFPLLPSGKVDRRALDALRLQPAAAGTSERAGNACEVRLQQVWETLLRVRSVGLDDNFFDLGGHSLLAARMLAQIEKQIGVRVSVSQLAAHVTIAQLASHIRQQGQSQPSLVVTLNAAGAGAPLFLAHGIGGSLLTFRELVKALGERQPIYGLRIPNSLEELDGPGAASDGITNHLIQRLAATYVRHMRSVVPYGPYQLAGHSSAGLVVVEMAQQLQALGSEVSLLALLDADIGQGSPRELPWKSWSALRSFLHRNLEELTHSFQFGMRELSMRKIHHYKRKLQLWLVQNVPRLSRRLPAAFVTEAHLALALNTFRPAPYHGDVLHYVGRDEPRSHDDPTLGWQTQVSGLLETIPLAGGHQTIFTAPYLHALATHLRARLSAGIGPTQPASAASVTADRGKEHDAEAELQPMGMGI